jgi:uncharacterized protein (DUF1697 family)
MAKVIPTLTTHIALLRGVNVAGNLLKMEHLRALLAELGLLNIRTYAQSGNVVFQAAGDVSDLSGRIEAKLLGQTRRPVLVMTKSADQIKRVIAANPFLSDAHIDRSKLHVTLLSEPVGKDAGKKLAAIGPGMDQFQIRGDAVYLYCPNGYGRTRLTNGVIERALALRATTRNWNTITILDEMASPEAVARNVVKQPRDVRRAAQLNGKSAKKPDARRS